MVLLLLQVATNYVWPFLEVAIEFLQLSTFNTYLVPPGDVGSTTWLLQAICRMSGC